MSILEVPGARLYYEIRGSGPPMVMVPGANGDARIFSTVADQLAAHYTVLTYDRRGFSRSELDGPQDDDRRLETDADDVRRLIDHVSDEPATIFGTSSGGVVVLEVLTRHPSVVRTLLPYEPAALRLLPDGETWVGLVFEIYDLYRRSGPEPALKAFRERLFAESDRQLMARSTNVENDGQVLANVTYWFEHELRQYPTVALDLDTLQSHADRIVPLVGRESRGYPAYQVNVELARRLGRDLTELPGGHAGYALHAPEFARELLDALAGRSARG
jgi:pimeloyl-ACP methyl ester carboxylesterase